MKDYTMLNVKLYGNEGEKLNNLVGAAGTDKSSFVRTCIFSDKVLVLDNAKYISRSLIEISDQLKGARRDGKLSDELISKTYDKLCDISKAFVMVSKRITDFKAQYEGGDE